MIELQLTTLEDHGVRLEPLAVEHADGLLAAASDGKLWELWFTAVPEPVETKGTLMIYRLPSGNCLPLPR